MANQWPAALQEYLEQQEFGLVYGDTTIRSSMDVGPSKVRRRFTKGVDEMTGSITVKNDLYSTWENFFKVTLAGGSLTFEYNHPITGVLTEYRFKGMPSVSNIGGEYFRVSMSWEEMP